MQAFEPALEARLELERYRRSIAAKPIEQLRREALQLAELALVTQPAAMQWLLRQLLEREQAQVPAVNDWHLGLAADLLDQPAD